MDMPVILEIFRIIWFFIKEMFEQANIPVPCGMKGWYTKRKKINRTTVFQICFMFGLDKKETDDFLCCVILWQRALTVIS